MKGENHIESVSPRSIEPYTDLGFDQFAKMINWGDTWTLEKVATDAHLATLGRPMYVINQHVFQYLTALVVGLPRVTISKAVQLYQGTKVSAKRVLPE